MTTSPKDPVSYDTTHAIEIADRVYWVGHHAPQFSLQCHVYLIEQGDQSVLIDPGPAPMWPHVRQKIAEIIPLSHLRYLFCSHADIDIIDSLSLVHETITRKDAAIVTHWRSGVLIKHSQFEKMPCWMVDEHDWQLPLLDRTLEFIFTPYAHFPGAICAFDPQSGVLFSSDLFASITSQSLFAVDETYFPGMRTFHEHYMPSKEVLGFALHTIEQYPVQMIAPQHGAIIPASLVQPSIDLLKGLDCGLYLIARGNTDIERLSKINLTLRDITQTLLTYRDFRDIAQNLLEIAQRFLPATALNFYAHCTVCADTLYLSPENLYRGTETSPPSFVDQILGKDHAEWADLNDGQAVAFRQEQDDRDRSVILLPLFSPDQGVIQAVALFLLSETEITTDDLPLVMTQMSVPLQVAVEREIMFRQLEKERQQMYEQSIRDILTGLFNRMYMREVVQRLCDIQDRSAKQQVAVLMLDIDHFKRINDGYGHHQGDKVLQRVAAEILGVIRTSDIAVRLGGEEFAIFVASEDMQDIAVFAERLRSQVAALRFDDPMQNQKVTISIGMAVRHPQEPLQDLIHRADMALYRAKNSGRNQVCSADEGE